MTSEEAINWIHSRLKFGTRPGLKRVQELANRLGNPQKHLKMVHIAGTNGKGSTVTFLRNIMEQKGLKIGTFTSPYIEHFSERMSINGVGISDSDLVRLVKKAQPIVFEMDKTQEFAGITEFELITVLAFLHFHEKKVKLAIIEVGLGGLFDSTNIIEPILTGITTIGRDHQEILGETVEEIAAQKAGILKEKIPCVLGNIEENARKVILETACSKNVAITAFGVDYFLTNKTTKSRSETFDFTTKNRSLQNIETTMIGRFQEENASMAIEMALKLDNTLTDEEIKRGIFCARWPGRMEKLCEKPLLYIDGAHNEPAMQRLSETIQTRFSGEELHVLFSALATKDIEQMVQELLKNKGVRLSLTTFDYPKAIEKKQIEALCEIYSLQFTENWENFLTEHLQKSQEKILVTGSLYFISQVRQFLLNPS